MRFIRVHGRIVPIHDKKEEGLSKTNAAVAGTAVGAGIHTRQSVKAAAVEKLAKNHRSLTKFQANLQPGDILSMGSTPKNSGGHEFSEISKLAPKSFRAHLDKAAKAVGIRKNTVIASNSSILTAAGAGKKYHAAVYLGKGKVAHMSTDGGAVIEHLHQVAEKQNITAMRFGNATKAETESAISFAKEAVKRKVPYQATAGTTSAFSNLIAPIGKKATQNFSPMVCHTMPIRAYAKRAFALGEHTYAGDFMKTPGITAVARHDIIKSSSLSLKAVLGNSAKGLKWGAAAAVGAAAINYALKKRKENGSR